MHDEFEDIKNPDYIDKIENETLYEDDSSEIPPIDIVAYNELRSCADLFRMQQNKTIDIKPAFQRDIVWNDAEQTRFIDSLIKKLPIPSMCFAYDYKDEKWIVIDGLQRMATIIRFLGDEDWQLSKLIDIDPDISGKLVKELKDPKLEFHKYYSRIENLTIPITVLRCILSNDKHTEYLFTIFHRLNSGGVKLNNQEIRHCIYSGVFNDLLIELDKNVIWRKINKIDEKKIFRFKYQELILRILTFIDGYENYNGRLSVFLNSYMKNNRKLDNKNILLKKENFEKITTFLWKTILNESPPAKKLKLTVLEALYVGIGRNINGLIKLDKIIVQQKYNAFINHQNFTTDSLREGLSDKSNVIERFQTAIQIFKS